MKIAVSTSGYTLETAMVSCFGRCNYFTVYDMDNGVYSNVLIAKKRRVGAGIRAAQTILENDIGVVIAENIGPNAHEALKTAGIPCYTAVSGTVKDCIAAYVKGYLPAARTATAPQYAGVAKSGRKLAGF
ncbi:MAG: NifB/NifX family molybdenum-iron cluster-binding protein [Bacillota bacterium]